MANRKPKSRDKNGRFVKIVDATGNGPQRYHINGGNGARVFGSSGGDTGGSRTPLDAVRERLDSDPAFSAPGAAPNFGQYAVPHVLSFQGLFGTFSKTYRPSDEAYKDSPENARFMRNDIGIMECIESRQRATALLDWHLEPEDENSADQKDLCGVIEKILRRISRFTEYRYNLLHALWYGKAAVQHRYRWVNIDGVMRVLPARLRDNPGWLPVNGDKLVFRYDDGTADNIPDQVGIRVGGKHQAGGKINDRWPVEATDRGLAYFFADWERPLLAIHKHMIEDGPWEDGIDAGLIHGVGIRSRIYWEWFQKQEAMAFLMEYLERSAGGIEIWYYPQGNNQAEIDTRKAAEERVSNQRNIVLVPKPMGEDAHAYGVDIIEPGMAGIDALKDLLTNYFGHRIKRYILGQVLSSEAEATGLGSGVAELHLDTLLQIIRYDATNLQETITTDLVEPIKNFNIPAARNTQVRFVIDTEAPDVEKKLEGWARAYEMGAKLKERDVMNLIGASIPDDEDVALQHPQFQQMDGQAGAQGIGADFAGMQQPPPQFDEEQMTQEAMSNYFGDPNAQDGGTVTYVAQNGKWTQQEMAFDTGSRSRADRDVESYTRELVERYEKGKPGWITLGGKGKGTPATRVYLDADGKITKGPKALTGKNVDDFKLKSEPATKKKGPNRTQKKLGLKKIKSGPDILNIDDLHVDPERFQYKLGANKKGVTAGQFSDIEYNPAFAGTIHIWRDPDNGKDYVVNGHHRTELAKRSGYKGKVQVFYLDADTPAEARAAGALINIAGGRGTAIDAAKFMRETGAKSDEMQRKGVSLKGKVAADADILKDLSNHIFRKVTLGTFRESRALAIARHVKDHDTQNKIAKQVDKSDKRKGRRALSDSVVEEMAREALLAGKRREKTVDLFGEHDDERSTFVERAELKSALRRDITSQLSAFKAVSSEKRAEMLTSDDQTITADTNREKAGSLEEFLSDFDRESSYKGELSDAINTAAEELADDPGKRKSITSRLIRKAKTILGDRETAKADDAQAAKQNVPDGEGSPRSGRKSELAGPGTYGWRGITERMNKEFSKHFQIKP